MFQSDISHKKNNTVAGKVEKVNEKVKKKVQPLFHTEYGILPYTDLPGVLFHALSGKVVNVPPPVGDGSRAQH